VVFQINPGSWWCSRSIQVPGGVPDPGTKKLLTNSQEFN
jgi:hypothetical protein